MGSVHLIPEFEFAYVLRSCSLAISQSNLFEISHQSPPNWRNVILRFPRLVILNPELQIRSCTRIGSCLRCCRSGRRWSSGCVGRTRSRPRTTLPRPLQIRPCTGRSNPLHGSCIPRSGHKFLNKYDVKIIIWVYLLRSLGGQLGTGA